MSAAGIPQPTPSASPMAGAGGAPSGAAPGGGTGAVTAPRPMMGAGMQGLTLVRTGVEALTKALQGIPMGSELHTAVLKAITDLTRRMGDGGGDHAAQVQALSGMAREQQQNPQAAIMQRMMQGNQGQPPSPVGGGQ